MKKALSFFDVIRFVISFFMFIVIYLCLESYFFSMMQTEKLTLGFLVRRYFVVEGLGSFVSLSFSLLVVSKRYKIVAGTLIMFVSLLFYLFAMVFSSLKSYIAFFANTVGLSFIATGSCLAILLWMKITSKTTKQIINEQQLDKNRKMPKTSKLLMLLALISVPATYITMIISSFITLGISLWVLGIVLQLPRLPISILIAIGLTPLVGIWVAFRALKAMFFSSPGFQAAVPIKLSDKPKLTELIKEVCLKIKTKLPDTVILHIEPTFFVTEGKVKALDNIVKGRILAISAPIVRQLTMNEFKAILAHEFAHFSGNDTAYSKFVIPVYRSINSAIKDIYEIYEGDKDTKDKNIIMNLLLFIPLNFLKIFIMYFATIDNILSRSRELRADWIASTNFGRKSMELGLTKVVQISQHYYDSYEKLGFNNTNYLDKYEQIFREDSHKLEEYKQKALLEVEQVFDTHPSLSTRLAVLPDSKYDGDQYIMKEIMQELLLDEKRLSDLYQQLVKNYTENKAKIDKVTKEFGLLNNAQMMIIQWVESKLKTELSLNNDDVQYISNCIFIGQNHSSRKNWKIDKIILFIKKDVKLFDLFIKGTVIRISLLNECGLIENVEKIKTKYSELEIDLDSLMPTEIPAFEEYVKSVNEFCSISK